MVAGGAARTGACSAGTVTAGTVTAGTVTAGVVTGVAVLGGTVLGGVMRTATICETASYGQPVGSGSAPPADGRIDAFFTAIDDTQLVASGLAGALDGLEMLHLGG